MASHPGLSLETILRINKLVMIEKQVEEWGDPCKELPNIRAIITAYRAGELVWEAHSRVTYWCNGKCIQGPSEFSWDDFRKLNTKENRAGGGFWIEGVSGNK